MDRIIEELREVLYDVFLEEIDPGKDVSLVEAFHADSFDLVEIMVALENRFGIEIEVEDMVHFSGTGTIVAYLTRRLAEINEWIAGKE
ncbi:MAG TPA: acyl carrier protein [Spirochaetota bacterium]